VHSSLLTCLANTTTFLYFFGREAFCKVTQDRLDLYAAACNERLPILHHYPRGHLVRFVHDKILPYFEASQRNS